MSRTTFAKIHKTIEKHCACNCRMHEKWLVLFFMGFVFLCKSEFIFEKQLHFYVNITKYMEKAMCQHSLSTCVACCACVSNACRGPRMAGGGHRQGEPSRVNLCIPANLSSIWGLRPREGFARNWSSEAECIGQLLQNYTKHFKELDLAIEECMLNDRPSFSQDLCFQTKPNPDVKKCIHFLEKHTNYSENAESEQTRWVKFGRSVHPY